MTPPAHHSANSPHLSREDIERVRTRHRLVDVLARAGVLDSPPTAGGRDLVISCPSPNHDDRTPSCVVHPNSDRFYCFGCGAHGDVFALMIELTGVRSLGKIAEILDAPGPISARVGALPARGAVVVLGNSPHGPNPERTTLERVLACNREAWRFLSSQRQADRARLYLARRGIDLWPLEAAAGRPLAGFTPRGNDGLTRHLISRGFTTDEALDAGWTLRAFGGARDRFCDRVLFPVTDERGQVLGAIGRDLTGRARARYLNTARTIAYHKGETVYAPHIPVPADATVVVCEGAVDALAVTAHGLPSNVVAVAPSGTSLTDAQARRIAAMTAGPLVVCADADDAGIEAGRRWAAGFARLGREPLVRTLPDGHDPASWLHRTGERGLLDLVPREAPRPQLQSLSIDL